MKLSIQPRLVIFVVSVVLLFISLFFFISRLFENQDNVIVYVSHDQDYAQPVLEAFERETGIRVDAVYDTEASKTVGLTNRLIAEKNNPQADVFWNNEVVRTIQLKKEGVLTRFKPVNFDKLGAQYKDPEGYWTGFAARARVLIVNTDYRDAAKRPSSLEDLVSSEFAGQITIADPRFGTTGPHIAALFTLWGWDKAEKYFMSLKNNSIDFAQSNGQTRDKVVMGEKWIGFTDTDDVNDALLKKQPVVMVYPDQKDGQIGTLIIPNTAMLIKGARHPGNGKRLIDYLVSEKTESQLAYAKSAQMPLLPGVKRPVTVPEVSDLKAMNANWEQIYKNLKPAINFMETQIMQ